MPSAFSAIGQAWKFFRKQPVLNDVLLWMIFTPLTIATLTPYFMALWTKGQEVLTTPQLLTGIGIEIFTGLWILWGIGAVLLIGKRIVKSPAGRTRSSFGSARAQATRLFIPLLLTNLLRAFITILWALPYIVIGTGLAVAWNLQTEQEQHNLSVWLTPLLIPAVIYQLRTMLANVVLACEGKEYNSALRRSQELLQGELLSFFVSVLGMLFIFFCGLMALGMALSNLMIFDPRLEIVITVVLSGGVAFVVVLFLLGLTCLYKSLLPQSAHGTVEG